MCTIFKFSGNITVINFQTLNADVNLFN